VRVRDSHTGHRPSVGQFSFLSPLGDLGATSSRCSFYRLIEKLEIDFLFVIIKLFFSRSIRFVTSHECDGQTDIGMTLRLFIAGAQNTLLSLI